MKTSTELFNEARQTLLNYRTDYAQALKHFKWPKLESFNWAIDWFDYYAKGNNRTALWITRRNGKHWEDEKISFQAMSDKSSRVARYYQKLGLKRGDRILIMLPNVLPLWETILAAIKLGAVVVPTATQATPVDLEDRIQRGNIKFILTDKEGIDKVDALSSISGLTKIVTNGQKPGWRDYQESNLEKEYFIQEGTTKASDPLLLYFTSGTTAKPKLVLHTHESYPVGHLSTMYWIGIKEGDVHQNISSPGWAKHAWSNFFAPWNAGATILVHDYSRFVPQDTLDVLKRCGVNTLCAPPTVWRMLILNNLGNKPESIRELVSAGEPLNPEVIETVEEQWKLQIRDGFGQTETTLQIGNSPGTPVKPGSMGRPMPGFNPVLLDQDSNETNEGEIALKLSPRPTGLMDAYIDDPERTAKVFKDGYYRTGDEAALDEDGYFHYVGRGDDVFKSSDYRISPFELESVLIEHEFVAEAAIIPSPDSVRLSVPKAIIVLIPDMEPTMELAREIFAYANQKLPSFKRIRRIEFAELPKTISGKIRRVQLRSVEHERIKKNERGEFEFWLEDL